MTMLHATILTLFPEMFPGPLAHSLIGKALQTGIWSLDTLNIREFGLGRHQVVDDSPYGGGAGMVMLAEVIDAAINEAKRQHPDATLIYFTPRGQRITQRLCCELIGCGSPHPTLSPGRGFDSEPELTPIARKLRQNQTGVEMLLWGKLRNRQLHGIKFRRQHPVAGFVADFFCEEANLVIELDGGQHNQPEAIAKDTARTQTLEAAGFHVLRFLNNEIVENLEGVLTTIAEKALSLGRGLGEGPRSFILLCGRYEAIDERIIEKHQPLEVSLGDFVMTGGELAAMALLDACVRLLPGVIGEPESLAQESFGLSEDYALLLEHPHYSKPPIWEGIAVPEALLSGHHANIERWRLEQSEQMTKARRPDLWDSYCKRKKKP